MRGSGPRAPTCCATPIPPRRQLRTLNHEEPVIDNLGDTGWDIADTYAVIENIDDLEAFLDALTAAIGESEVLRTVFVITDDDRQFQATARRLDDLGVDSHRLYASYLTNFEFTNGDAQ